LNHFQDGFESLRVFRPTVRILWIIFCLALTTASHAAGPPHRVILLESLPVPVVLEHSRWFIRGMSDLGYPMGNGLDLLRLEANGDPERAELLLRDALTKIRPDLVVTNATLASQAAAPILAKAGIPQLFFTVSDPVGAGLIREVGVPTGNNLTGKVHTLSRDTKLKMVIRLTGQAFNHRPVRFGIIYSRTPSARGDFQKLREAAAKRGDAVFLGREIPYRKIPDGMAPMMADVVNAVRALDDQVDGWFEPSGPLGELPAYTRRILETSAKPIVFGNRLDSARQGALLHMTPDPERSGREAAKLAVDILNGRAPGDIPPAPPSLFKMGVNLGTALDLGITVPPDILALAGEDVFR
jgi:putative ABC transport system substrate-binding protein